MRRYRVPELTAGFLLGFAVLLVIFLLSSDIAAHYEVCETTKEGAKECATYNVLSYALHKLNDYNGAITAIATAFIAWFTLSLRQSTDRLWDAGERQLRLADETSNAQSRAMIASIAVADRAAKAAELSAKAAIGSKLPSIRIGKIKLFKPGPPYGTADNSFKSEIFDGRPPNHAQLLIPVSNLGDTNAEITGLCVNWFVGQHLNGLPPYKNALSFIETVIKAGGEFEFTLTNFFLNFTPAEDRALDLILATHLWVYGYISYVDFMGTSHERRFCQRWAAGPVLGSPKGFVPEWSTPQEDNLQSY